jgi:hypothetical protein
MTDRSTLPEVSERAEAHHLRRLRRKIGAVLVVVLVVLALIAIGVSQFSGSVVITAANSAKTTQPIREKQYQELFDEYYKKHPVERFRFVTNYEGLTAWLQESAPEVAKVVPDGMEELGVSRYRLEFRTPAASWQVNDKRYYVDTNGVTFLTNYFAEPSVTVIDNSGVKTEQGKAIASSRLLSFVGQVVALSSQKGVSVTQVEIPAQSTRQVYIHGEGLPVMRMTIDKGVGEQVNDMAAALQYFKERGETPSYIDVRVPSRAFYK